MAVAHGNVITIRSCHGHYLCANPNGHIEWNRQHASIWEMWTLVHVSGDTYGLRSHHHNHLCIDDSKRVVADRPWVNVWEHMTFIKHGDKYAIRSHWGTYLSAQPHGTAEGNRGQVGPWELVTVDLVGENPQTAETRRRKEEEARRQAELQRARDEANRLREQARKAEEARRVEAKRRRNVIQNHLQTIDQNLQQEREELHRQESILAEIQEELAAEQAARAQFEPTPDTAGCVKIVLIGNTGDGKSTLANRFMGDVSLRGGDGLFATSILGRSQTQRIQIGFVDVDDRKICIADTPGAGDTEHMDRHHTNRLVDFLRGIGQIDAFLLVRKFTSYRLMAQDQFILRDLAGVFGEGFWKSVIVVLTHVDDGADEEDLQGVSREFPNELGRHLGVDQNVVASMPVFGIGRRNYHEQCRTILSAVVGGNQSPFISDMMVAPVEQKQAEYDRQQSVCEQHRASLAALVAQQTELRNELTEI